MIMEIGTDFIYAVVFNQLIFHCADNARAMPEAPEMSSATKDILAKVRKMVPPMLEKFHKGLCATCS